ncbi:ciliary neurotrophic factor receptor subunit alpha-like [Sinocyclocheilus grahami]|uniref:ciliary neurotrophic factor receptor subunit alpha-like n=1 Tax=Sinocyclocheilus grahami TaxID=75366 RepID=UPI0007AD116C|nr:PREDICTED: ciliary neurotrophic factor receptor subunit alpha-like [Sinocyclocheilus grahami]
MEIGTWSDWSVAVHATPWMEEPKPITSTTESDIIPGSVAAKDMEIGTWSDWSVAVHATPWMEEPKPITSTTESDIIPETTPGPPSAAPRVGEPTAACSTLLWSTHLLLACVLLSIM